MRPRAEEQSPLAWSRDHILPRERGGGLWLYADAAGTEATRNWRAMCKGCNNLLAVAGHCMGALACASGIRGRSRDSMLREWRMLQIAEAMPRPSPVEARALRIMRSPNGEAGARAGVPAPRSPNPKAPNVLSDDFVFPATTPAARVWNLATLAQARG